MTIHPPECGAETSSGSMVVLDVLTAMRLEPADIAERQARRLRALLDATTPIRLGQNIIFMRHPYPSAPRARKPDPKPRLR